VLSQYGLDLSQLDVKAPDLYLTIGATKELNIPIGKIPT
jgi:hypothetical protein